MEASEASVPWESYQLIVPHHTDSKQEEKSPSNDCGGRDRQSNANLSPSSVSCPLVSPTYCVHRREASSPTAMEFLIFIPNTKVYCLLTSPESGHLEWKELPDEGAFAIAQAVGNNAEDELYAAIMGMDTKGVSFLWRAAFDMEVTPESHGRTFHFRSTTGSVLAVWLQDENTAERMLDCVLRVFHERRPTTWASMGMSDLLDLVKAAEKMDPSQLLAHEARRIRDNATAPSVPPTTSSTCGSIRKEVPSVVDDFYRLSSSDASVDTEQRSIDPRRGREGGIGATLKADAAPWVPSYAQDEESTQDVFVNRGDLRLAIQAALDTDEFIERIITYLGTAAS